ncbi:MAG: hypothetical protein KJ630_04395 [Proteobacteria bacterium]|nr:hypothetical protein [Pseudomonadota bacterium]
MENIGDQNTTKALIPSAVGGDYIPWAAGFLPALVQLESIATFSGALGAFARTNGAP